ncbi:hypothetical protein JHK86_034509 [Glycine max]|nr:hypothetical protein JHK86_034509 [Glycine max]
MDASTKNRVFGHYARILVDVDLAGLLPGDSSKAKKPQANITSEPQLETIVANMADETEEEISDPDETTVAVEKEPPFINVVSKSQKKKMKKNGKSPQGATSKKFQRGSLQNSFLMKIYDRFH